MKKRAPNRSTHMCVVFTVRGALYTHWHRTERTRGAKNRPTKPAVLHAAFRACTHGVTKSPLHAMRALPPPSDEHRTHRRSAKAAIQRAAAVESPARREVAARCAGARWRLEGYRRRRGGFLAAVWWGRRRGGGGGGGGGSRRSGQAGRGAAASGGGGVATRMRIAMHMSMHMLCMCFASLRHLRDRVVRHLRRQRVQPDQWMRRRSEGGQRCGRWVARGARARRRVGQVGAARQRAGRRQDGRRKGGSKGARGAAKRFERRSGRTPRPAEDGRRPASELRDTRAVIGCPRDIHPGRAVSAVDAIVAAAVREARTTRHHAMRQASSGQGGVSSTGAGGRRWYPVGCGRLTCSCV